MQQYLYNIKNFFASYILIYSIKINTNKGPQNIGIRGYRDILVYVWQRADSASIYFPFGAICMRGSTFCASSQISLLAHKIELKRG